MENVQTDALQLDKRIDALVGYRARVEVTFEASLSSAETIVDLEEKLQNGTTTAEDLNNAIWSALQLTMLYKQTRIQASSGSIPLPEDRGTLNEIDEELKQPNLSPEEIKDLMSRRYIADPKLGAVKAVDVLEQLHTLFPDVPLKEK